MSRPRHTPAAEARAHILTFLRAGYQPATIARATGVAPQTIRKTADGTRSNLNRSTARLLLQVTHARLMAAAPDGVRVPSVGTTRRLRVLYHLGWSTERIGTETGLADSVVWRQLQGTYPTTKAGIARTVATFYDRTWDTPPPCPTHFARAGATRARRIAAERGWTVPAMAWDDDTIDDPAATPDLGEADEFVHQRLHLDDLEHLLGSGGWTWPGITARLGVTQDAIYHACRRHERFDLYDRIAVATTGEAPDHRTTTSGTSAA